MPEEPFELTDDVVDAKWAEIAPLIEVVSARIEDPGEFPVQPSSELAQDDIASNPYHVSHCARWCLNAGIDHLHALKSLVIDANRIHSAAPYGLVRGALENFGAGFWLLHPSESSKRVEHGLRWWAKNFKDQDKATKGMDQPNYTPLEPKLQKLVKTGRAVQCDPKKVRNGYFSSPVLEYADKHSSASNPYLVWQVCSGFAHGRPWANLGMNEMDTHSTENGVALIRLTSDHKRILAVTMPAMHLMEDLLRLYQERSRAAD